MIVSPANVMQTDKINFRTPRFTFDVCCSTLLYIGGVLSVSYFHMSNLYCLGFKARSGDERNPPIKCDV